MQKQGGEFRKLKSVQFYRRTKLSQGDAESKPGERSTEPDPAGPWAPWSGEQSCAKKHFRHSSEPDLYFIKICSRGLKGSEARDRDQLGVYCNSTGERK